MALETSSKQQGTDNDVNPGGAGQERGRKSSVIRIRESSFHLDQEESTVSLENSWDLHLYQKNGDMIISQRSLR